MMTYRIISSSLLALTNSILFGQPATTTTDLLTGTWYLTNSVPTNDSLVYNPISNAPNNWGDRIEFNADNSFVDAYTTPCRNDNRIHHDTGMWELSNITITTSIPISFDQGTKHEILIITVDKLVLKKFIDKTPTPIRVTAPTETDRVHLPNHWTPM